MASENKYLEIYNSMAPGVVQSAAKWGVSAATLLAMAKRGLVDVYDGSPKLYSRKPRGKILEIMDLVAEYKPEYFGLFKEGEQLGMLCRIKDGLVVDAWDKPYDLEDVYLMRIGKKAFPLDEI